MEGAGISGLAQSNPECRHWIRTASRLLALCILCHRGQVSGIDFVIMAHTMLVHIWLVDTDNEHAQTFKY